MSQRLAQLRETGQSPAPIEKRIKRFDGRTVPVFVAATQLIDKERAAVRGVARSDARVSGRSVGAVDSRPHDRRHHQHGL